MINYIKNYIKNSKLINYNFFKKNKKDLDVKEKYIVDLEINEADIVINEKDLIIKEADLDVKEKYIDLEINEADIVIDKKDLIINEEDLDIKKAGMVINEKDQKINNIDDKQLRINILILIKLYTNTYYKYTNDGKFSKKLYNVFINNEFIISCLTVYDDNNKISIFDKYIIEYIKKRNNVIEYLQSKNKIINLKNNFESLNDINTSNDYIDVLFILDMPAKDIFLYCYILLYKHKNISYIKNILLSVVIKYNNQQIRLKVDSFIGKTKFINF
jgi:hypothetical protein